MSLYRLDAPALHAALDTKRAGLGWSWRTLGRRLDLSASTLARMRTGREPSADVLVTCLVWLDFDTDLLAAGLIRPADQEADPT